ncbi:hypothetical protein YA0059_22575 [Pseudomonas syringae]|uniref:hypothetical protein n=1 Tax=Pseudomonas syringae group TaxID=136849 RepID=UPI0013DEACAF|nr:MULTISPECIES: hypothetical protein [Pseudomonas syringae group]MBI6768632.1 hypothetical protein [Pseudomonas syringae]MBI6788475.1 hypothetical protein [Pseudomonas syringae]
MPRPLTAEEFDTMMFEFDQAGAWMSEQLALGRAELAPVLPARGNDEVGRTQLDHEG